MGFIADTLGVMNVFDINKLAIYYYLITWVIVFFDFFIQVS